LIDIMKQISYIFVLVIFYLLIIVLEVYSAEQLTLSQCIQIGVSNAFSIKKHENILKIYNEQLHSSYGNLLPSIDAGFDYLPYNRSFQQLVDMGELLNPQATRTYKYYTAQTTSNDANYFIRGSLTLFDGMSNIYKIKSSISQNLGYQNLLKREKEQIVYDILKYYYQLMLDKELLTIADENLLLSNKTLDKITVKVKTGDLPVSDLYQQQAKVSDYKLLSLQRQNAVTIDKINLLNKIGYPDIDDSIVFENITLPSFTNFPELDKNELIKTALSNRSDYLSKQYFAEANKFIINISKSELYPKVNLITQLSAFGTEASSYRLNDIPYYIGSQTNVFDMLFKNTALLYGLQIKWKIFDGFTTSTNIQKSKLEYLNSVIELDEIKSRISTDIYILIADYNSSLNKIKATDSGLIAANQAYSTISERFNLGLADFTDLAEAHASLVKAKSERVQALYNMDFQSKVISYYTGLLNQASYTNN